jgi:hypothetical protein
LTPSVLGFKATHVSLILSEESTLQHRRLNSYNSKQVETGIYFISIFHQCTQILPSMYTN